MYGTVNTILSDGGDGETERLLNNRALLATFVIKLYQPKGVRSNYWHIDCEMTLAAGSCISSSGVDHMTEFDHVIFPYYYAYARNQIQDIRIATARRNMCAFLFSLPEKRFSIVDL